MDCSRGVVKAKSIKILDDPCNTTHTNIAVSKIDSNTNNSGTAWAVCTQNDCGRIIWSMFATSGLWCFKYRLNVLLQKYGSLCVVSNDSADAYKLNYARCINWICTQVARPMQIWWEIVDYVLSATLESLQLHGEQENNNEMTNAQVSLNKISIHSHRHPHSNM